MLLPMAFGMEGTGMYGSIHYYTKYTCPSVWGAVVEVFARTKAGIR